MLGIIGLPHTALGTITAIIKPTIAGRWGGNDTAHREKRLRARYYSGIFMIVIGTIMQIFSALLA